MSEAARKLRIRMANNGRNPANGNMGIRVGSDLHLAEIILSQRDSLLSAARAVVAHEDASVAAMKAMTDEAYEPPDLPWMPMLRAVIAKAEAT